MQKGKYGVCLWFYALVAFILAFLGQVLLGGLLLGFVIVAEKNEWLTRQVIQAFFLTIIVSVINAVLDLLNIFGKMCIRDRGTTVTAVFKPSHIDMTPLGDINSTVGLLIYSNPERDFIFRRERDGRSFALDTRELREILGEEVKLSAPEVSEWIQGYLKEQTDMIFGGAQEDENIS